MFAGLRSRWMIPCSCARFERLGDLLRDRQRLVDRDRAAARSRCDRSSPSTSSITSGTHTARFFEAVDVRDVRMVQ